MFETLLEHSIHTVREGKTMGPKKGPSFKGTNFNMFKSPSQVKDSLIKL